MYVLFRFYSVNYIMATAMSTDETTNSSNNDLLRKNPSDMAQQISNSSLNNPAELDSRHAIPMNLLPAGNCEICILID